MFVNVKPLPGNKYKTVTRGGTLRAPIKGYQLVKKTERGAHNPNDPFYSAIPGIRHAQYGGPVIPAQGR